MREKAQSGLLPQPQRICSSSVDMRWPVPLLAIFSFALAACAGLLVLKSACSVPELGAIELLAGMAVFLIYGFLVLNIVLTLKNFQRN
jgi:hypothetical protein